MKRQGSLTLVAVFLCFLGCASTESPVRDSSYPPLMQNSGFENLQSSSSSSSSSLQPVGWSSLPDGWSIDSNTARSGRYSLKVQNYSPSWYAYPSQEIFPYPGKSYRIGIWVKGENLTNTKSDQQGATFCIEFFDDGWSWLGGEYTVPKLEGTFDWKHLLAEEIVIPVRWMGTRVAHVKLSPLLTRGTTGTAWWGTTGTAWFDDLSIEEIVPSPLETFLLEPNYRGMLIPELSKLIRLQVTLHPEAAGLSLRDLRDLAVHVRLVKGSNGDSGDVVQETLFSSPGSQEFELTLTVPDNLPEGAYVLRSQLIKGKEGKEGEEELLLAETKESIQRISRARRDLCPAFIDQDNRLLCRGTPFFPLGIYTANTEFPADELKAQIMKISDSPFHVLVNYDTLAPLNWEWQGKTSQICYDFILHNYLDLLDEYGLKILCPLPSLELLDITESAALSKLLESVAALKDHPAILGWYLNDEIGPSYRSKLMAFNQATCAADPNHPTWSVQYQLQVLDRMATTTDILGVDPYPVPHTPVVYVAEAADAAQKAGLAARPFWMVVQAHGVPVSLDKEMQRPTREEVLCMTYLGLIHGARGLFYYSYFDIWGPPAMPDAAARWKWLKGIGAEVKSMEGILLSCEDAPQQGISCSQAAVHFLITRYQDSFYLLMTNPSGATVQATFRGSDHLYLTELRDFLQPENKLQEIRNNQFTVTLASLERRVYSWPAPTNSER